MQASGVNLTFATPQPSIRNANVKSKTPLPICVSQWSFDSNICKSACQIGVQMLESDHWPAYHAISEVYIKTLISL